MTTLRRAGVSPRHAVLLVLIGALWALIYRSAGTSFAVYDSREGSEALALADSLVSTGAYANAYSGAGLSGPSAASPPVIPFAIFLIKKATGNRFPALAFLFCLVAYGIHSLLLVLVSADLLGSSRPGWVAALLTAVLPVYRVLIWSDAIYVADAVMLSIVATAWLLRRFDSHPLTAFAIGAITGVMLLLNAVAASIVLSFLAWFLVRDQTSFLRRGRAAAYIAVGVLCTILPWTVRNVVAMHALIPIRDDTGILLFTAYNDCAVAGMEQLRVKGCLQLSHPGFSVKENRALLDLGEVAYNQKKLSDTLKWVRAHPGKAGALSLQRAADFWFPPLQPAVWLIVLLGLGGVALLLLEHCDVALPWCSALGIYPIAFYVLPAQAQNGYPMLWLLGLAGGYLLTAGSRRSGIDKGIDTA